MTINCRGNLIDLATPKVMGILNVTPDSFYDGGKYKDSSAILRQTEKMLEEGASFIDIGAYSSRPGAEFVPEEVELERLVPIISLIIKHFPEALLSADTFRSSIAQLSIDEGAALINDISAGNLDPDMMPTIARIKVPYIMMHMKGTPQTMKELNIYKNLVEDISFYFSEKIEQARALGICDLIIDPGFGFAKNVTQNFELLQKFDLLKTFEVPVLAGISRKSMIYKTLKIDASQALNGTTALHMVALQKGANILRAHDVKEAAECITLFQKLIA
jgi:dihydropteroate synthase